MAYKSDKVRLRDREVKTLLNQVTMHQSEEAHHIGISTSTINQKLNTLDDKYHLSLAEASLHSQARKIAQWFCEKVGLTAVDPKVDPGKLNGTTDDEFLKMISKIGASIEILNTSQSPQAINMVKENLMELKSLIFQTEQELHNNH